MRNATAYHPSHDQSGAVRCPSSANSSDHYSAVSFGNDWP